MRAFLCLLAVLLVPGVALADGKIQPSTGVKLQALTDGAGNVCTPGAPCAILNSGGTLTPHDPDVGTVSTGGTAVSAFIAGHTAKGGWIMNPLTATAPLCVRVTGTATTADGSGTSCIAAGQTYYVAPGAGAVSVNATDGGHVIDGVGYF